MNIPTINPNTAIMTCASAKEVIVFVPAAFEADPDVPMGDLDRDVE